MSLVSLVHERCSSITRPSDLASYINFELPSRVSDESVNEKRIYASVPYIKGISEPLQRAFKSHEVTLVHNPLNSWRSQLVRVKDKTESLKKCGTVHHIHCEQCDKDYVGETSRLLKHE